MTMVIESRTSIRSDSTVSSIPRMDSLTTQLDIWSLIKRGTCESSFSMLTKFRLNKPIIRSNSVKVTRKRKCGDSRKQDDTGNESTSSTSDTSFDWETIEDDDDVFDLVEVFRSKCRTKSRGRLGSRPDSTDIPYLEEVASTGTRVQKMYLKKCADFRIAPATIFVRGLTSCAIDLAHHNIGRKGAHACAIALAKASGIHSLSLNDNDIGPGGTRHVAKMLQENTKITDVSLSDNNMQLKGFTHLANVVIEFDKIHRLDLSNNGFTEKDAPIFKQMLEETRNLKYLNLSHNEFRENGGVLIGDALSWNDSLTELDLSWNHFRRSGAIGIADGLMDNTSLVSLNLAWNGCYLEGCMAFGRCLVHNTVLRVLDLTNNRIDRECVEWLAKGLAKNSTLRTLILKFNPLTSEGANDILKFIAGCPTTGIRRLDLGVQQVQPNFVVMLNEIHLKGRKLEVTYGQVVGQMVVNDDEEEQHLLEENPTLVLIEFGKLMGFRLFDLFSSLDKNGNRVLERKEIANGLKMANIPLTAKGLDKLIRNLDTNHDGDIDFGELLVAQQFHRREMAKSIAAQRHKGEPAEDSNIVKIREKLRQLMAKKMGDYPAFRRSSRLLVNQIQERKRKIEEELGYTTVHPPDTDGSMSPSPETAMDYGSRSDTPDSLQDDEDKADTFGPYTTNQFDPNNTAGKGHGIASSDTKDNSRPSHWKRPILRKLPSVQLPIRRKDIEWFYSTDLEIRPKQAKAKASNTENETGVDTKDKEDTIPESPKQGSMNAKDIHNILLKQTDDYESYARKVQHEQRLLEDTEIESMAVKQLQEAAEKRKQLALPREKKDPWEMGKTLGVNGSKRFNQDKAMTGKGTKPGHSRAFQRRWSGPGSLERHRTSSQNKIQMDLPNISVEEFD